MFIGMSMVAKKDHPHPSLKATRKSVKAARQMQKPCGKCKSCAANAKKQRGCLNLVHAVSHYHVGIWNLVLYSEGPATGHKSGGQLYKSL